MAKYINKPDKNSPEYLAGKANSGRHSLLLILIFTLVNLVMVLLDTGTYFLFSASVPYYLTLLGKAFDNGFADGAWSVNGTCTIVALVVSVVVLTLYFLCWLLSDKRPGWLTVALVLFVVDTVGMVAFTYLLYDNPAANIIDVVFHVWAIVELFQAVRAHKKLKDLPFPETEALSEPPAGPEL